MCVLDQNYVTFLWKSSPPSISSTCIQKAHAMFIQVCMLIWPLFDSPFAPLIWFLKIFSTVPLSIGNLVLHLQSLFASHDIPLGVFLIPIPYYDFLHLCCYFAFHMHFYTLVWFQCVKVLQLWIIPMLGFEWAQFSLYMYIFLKTGI